MYKCPVCNSSDTDYDGVNVIEDCLIHECECNVCGATWENVFAFVESRNIKKFLDS